MNQLFLICFQMQRKYSTVILGSQSNASSTDYYGVERTSDVIQ